MNSTFNPDLLSEFARSYRFHYDMCDPNVMVQDVLVEMERGLKGLSSPLPMIPSYLSPVSKVSADKTVIALDAGGTNFRAALVRFTKDGKPIAQGMRKAPMPGTKGRVNAVEFFNQIAGLIEPLIKEADSAIEGIGFCFSYPMEMKEDGDGIATSFSKEVDAADVLGKPIGRSLRQALEGRGVKVPERIVLLNDTVATLLSGLGQIPADSAQHKISDKYGVPGGPVLGFILGTGFNTAYPEKEIPKIGFSSKDKPQIVVCETGNSVPRYLGILDKEFDAGTKHPNTYLLEKATAGAYLGPLTFHILKQAISDGVLSFKRAAEFAAWPTLETRCLNEFMNDPLSMQGPIGELFDKDELDPLRSFAYLTLIVTKRGAMFSAAAVAAAVERMDAGYDPFAPVRIAVEGTTYMIYRGMREALESSLHLMLNRDKQRSYIIAPVEQASLFGAAAAALSC